jgi:hypothetical protein
MIRRAKIGLSLALGLGLAVSLLAGRAAASKTFPEALRQKLELPQVAGTGMGCQLCHQDDTGGLMTATKPFGRALIQAGVQATNVPSLLSALTQLKTDGHDSDRDGMSDIAELKAGTDPNVAATSEGSPPPATEDIPLAQTGCTLTASTASGSAWTPLALVGVLLLGWRRRSRR